MRSYAPNYYPKFRCSADRCRHSCCIGWEIDIDEYTLAAYERMPGETGELIRAHIQREGENASFRLTDNDRCPFLQEDGLCRLILTEGEESLCYICRTHPRFHNFFSERMETGIGLCCEEAAKLILFQEEETSLILLEGEGEKEILWDEECSLLALRDRLFRLLQNRSKPFEERVTEAFASVGVKPFSPDALPDFVDILFSLENLDPGWLLCLNALKHPAPKQDIPNLDSVLEKAMLYFIYRHLADAVDDRDFSSRLRFAHFSVTLLAALTKHTPLPIEELARMYSCEIEYSTENVEKLLSLL